MSRGGIAAIVILGGAAALFALNSNPTALDSRASATSGAEASYLQRLPEDEVVYFVLPDRFENGDSANDTGGIPGGRLEHGFDPSHKGFFHGGDLQGLTARLDYVQSLGATAIWLGPIYKNKAVQGDPGSESSGYHGYWITDFTDVDPHFGSKEDLKTFVDAAHARGIKIYLDIITNHTADVIRLRECHDPAVVDRIRPYGGCTYRSRAEYPYTTEGLADGAAINTGFMGDTSEYQTKENFEKLVRPDFAYTPYVSEAEKSIKVPAWLNDMRYYHNRGDSTFEGESSLYGDFVGLDDLMTENPRVVEGFIEIFKDWISDYKIDGFRVDTARHVNQEFWQAFIPAIIEHAENEGIPNFYIFGEAAIHDPATLIKVTHAAGFPSVLDFILFDTVKDVLIRKESTHRLAELFAVDSLYKGGSETAGRLAAFNGNHDDGRFAGTARTGIPDITDQELFQRVKLAYALMFFGRGVPIIYYGDEQGFVSDGRDQAAREDMFPSQVASYNDNDLVATDATTAETNFDQDHPLYRAFQEMAAIHQAHVTLRRGEQVTRLSEREGEGLFAFSRLDEQSGEEYLVVLNTGTKEREAQVDVDAGSQDWQPIYGECEASVAATGSYKVRVAPLDFVICRSGFKR